MRGKVPEYLGGDRIMRITPAHAGKRVPVHSAARCSWDHPRMCGEKSMSLCLWNTFPGSPPHVRGKENDTGIRKHKRGITPACAGKSSVRELLLIVSRDHPRMCGEKDGFHGS